MGRKIKSKQSKGLGDTIEKFTEATGIKALVHAIIDDCGCEQRKEMLNKLFPYKVECLNEIDEAYLKDFFGKNVEVLTSQHQRDLKAIYERVFNRKVNAGSCAGCWRDVIGRLRKVYSVDNE